MRDLVACGLVLAAAAPAAVAQQTVSDPSFEISGPLFPAPGPWLQSSTFFGTPLCDGRCSFGISVAHTGQWWAWFGGNSAFGPEHGVVAQTILVPEGGAALTFYLRAESDRADGADFFRITLDSAPVFTLLDRDTGPYNFAYQAVQIDISAHPGPRLLKFEGVTLGQGFLTNFFVDDVSIDPGHACYANCDGSTITPSLNVNDFQCFLNRYSAGDVRANCDGSTESPVLNVNDLMCFTNLYSLGCPLPIAPAPVPPQTGNPTQHAPVPPRAR